MLYFTLYLLFYHVFIILIFKKKIISSYFKNRSKLSCKLDLIIQDFFIINHVKLNQTASHFI
jgi:hypothetical protein